MFWLSVLLLFFAAFGQSLDPNQFGFAPLTLGKYYRMYVRPDGVRQIVRMTISEGRAEFSFVPSLEKSREEDGNMILEIKDQEPLRIPIGGWGELKPPESSESESLETSDLSHETGNGFNPPKPPVSYDSDPKEARNYMSQTGDGFNPPKPPVSYNSDPKEARNYMSQSGNGFNPPKPPVSYDSEPKETRNYMSQTGNGFNPPKPPVSYDSEPKETRNYMSQTGNDFNPPKPPVSYDSEPKETRNYMSQTSTSTDRLNKVSKISLATPAVNPNANKVSTSDAPSPRVDRWNQVSNTMMALSGLKKAISRRPKNYGSAPEVPATALREPTSMGFKDNGFGEFVREFRLPDGNTYSAYMSILSGGEAKFRFFYGNSGKKVYDEKDLLFDDEFFYPEGKGEGRPKIPLTGWTVPRSSITGGSKTKRSHGISKKYREIPLEYKKR